MSLEIHLDSPSVPPVHTLTPMAVVGVLKDADKLKPVRAFLLQGLEAMFSEAAREKKEGIEVRELASLCYRLTLYGKTQRLKDLLESI